MPPMTLEHWCPWCGEPLTLPPMPAKHTELQVACPECTKEVRWTSGVRTDRFRWFPTFKCAVAWCEDKNHYMTPMCRVHWDQVPAVEAQRYWRSLVDALPAKPAMEIAMELAKKIREPLKPIKVTFEF